MYLAREAVAGLIVTGPICSQVGARYFFRPAPWCRIRASQQGQPRIGQSGSIQGFNAMIYTYPQSKITIVVLNNTDGRAAEFEAAVAHAVFQK